ncbi:MAG: DUF3592 domain-containing protein [Planctomycetes bacterium]|nr:DUF3592 domain-containing protein [Planctomycetota bacterium]
MRIRNTPFYWISGAIFALVGAGGLIVNAYISLTHQETSGKIIEIMNSRNSNYKPKYSYIVEGKEYTNHDNLNLKYDIYEVGQEISVLYKEDDPTDAMLNNKVLNYGTFMIFLILGLIPYIEKLLLRLVSKFV